MNRVRPALLTLILLLLLAGAVRAQAGGGYDLTWNTVDGGGGPLTGGAYSLTGTIGQPDAATLSGGAYTLAGGFWGGISTAQRRLYLPVVLRGS